MGLEACSPRKVYKFEYKNSRLVTSYNGETRLCNRLLIIYISASSQNLCEEMPDLKGTECPTEITTLCLLLQKTRNISLN